MPTQMGRTESPVTSFKTTIGILVMGSIIRPRIFISISTSPPFQSRSYFVSSEPASLLPGCWVRRAYSGHPYTFPHGCDRRWERAERDRESLESCSVWCARSIAQLHDCILPLILLPSCQYTVRCAVAEWRAAAPAGSSAGASSPLPGSDPRTGGQEYWAAWNIWK